jgi:hypothetical protein
MTGSERPYFIVLAAIGALTMVGVAVFWVSAASGGADGDSVAYESGSPTAGTGPAAAVTEQATPAETPTPTRAPSTPVVLVPPTDVPSPVATPAATLEPPTPEPPASTPAASAAGTDLSGRWRIVDTVTEGAGAGQSFTFDVTLTQSGASLMGGNAELSIGGEVADGSLSATFSQPGGITGTFLCRFAGDTGSGTFQSSVPNSGTSALSRLP